MTTTPPELLVACDGSCLKNPGGATGWAYVTADGKWSSASQKTGTNQVAELWGVLSVLRDFPDQPLAIQIDSSYAMDVATKWSQQWAKNGWKNRNGETVSNLALVRAIYMLMRERRYPVRFVKVEGHDPDNRWPLNTVADLKARQAAGAALDAEKGGTLRFSGVERDVLTRRTMTQRAVLAELERCASCHLPISVDGQCRCSM